MILEEAKKIVGLLVDLWPRSSWTQAKGDAWLAALPKYSVDHARAVIREWAQAKNFPPSIAEFRRAAASKSTSHGRPVSEGGGRAVAETPVARIRRINRVPDDVSDSDVLVWFYRSEISRSREVYGRGFSAAASQIRARFESDWAASFAGREDEMKSISAGLFPGDVHGPIHTEAS